jgi:hypothetical protein
MQACGYRMGLFEWLAGGVSAGRVARIDGCLILWPHTALTWPATHVEPMAAIFSILTASSSSSTAQSLPIIMTMPLLRAPACVVVSVGKGGRGL